MLPAINEKSLRSVRESWIVVWLSSSNDAFIVLRLQPALQVRKWSNAFFLWVSLKQGYIFFILQTIAVIDNYSFIILPKDYTVGDFGVLRTLQR